MEDLFMNYPNLETKSNRGLENEPSKLACSKSWKETWWYKCIFVRLILMLMITKKLIILLTTCCDRKGSNWTRGPWFFYCAGITDQDFRVNSAVNFFNESGEIDDFKEWWWRSKEKEKLSREVDKRGSNSKFQVGK